MDKRAEKELYKKAMLIYGTGPQVEMAIEECSELITVLCHARRGRKIAKGIAYEIADVEIMCGQLREIIGDDIVSQCKEEKLLRLEQRIDNRPTIKCK